MVLGVRDTSLGRYTVTPLLKSIFCHCFILLVVSLMIMSRLALCLQWTTSPTNFWRQRSQTGGLRGNCEPSERGLEQLWCCEAPYKSKIQRMTLAWSYVWLLHARCASSLISAVNCPQGCQQIGQISGGGERSSGGEAAQHGFRDGKGQRAGQQTGEGRGVLWCCICIYISCTVHVELPMKVFIGVTMPRHSTRSVLLSISSWLFFNIHVFVRGLFCFRKNN